MRNSVDPQMAYGPRVLLLDMTWVLKPPGKLVQSRVQSIVATFEILALIVDRCSSEIDASCSVPLGIH